VTGKNTVSLALVGDVMTGRGIDQILPHPSPPVLYEEAVESAVDYVALAEFANGPIRRRVGFDYIWGAALAELDRRQPDVRIVNLETAVTRANRPEPKGINYRMSPDNVPCLTAAAVDCCVLANNHVLDWGRDGLAETLAVLTGAGLKTAGAGLTVAEAAAPAVLPLPGGVRVLVYGLACPSSGVPPDWEATATRSGVHLVEPSAAAIAPLAERIGADRRPGDLVVVSIHWGRNWGYAVPAADRAFAHALVEAAGVDVVHGHSSHHVKAVEICNGKPVLYGCGDFLNDYEGIRGYADYRSDLTLMYVAEFDADRRLVDVAMVPFKIRNFTLARPNAADVAWLHDVMRRECHHFGADVRLDDDGALRLSGPAGRS
jgi:poly-gamma-glutamate capsule biosynthesis protein CapA/YwtB (metallophosphatase superfamily)